MKSLILLLLPLSALAAAPKMQLAAALDGGVTVVGNGGDVLDCPDQPLRVLDVYELEDLGGGHLRSRGTPGDYSQKLEKNLQVIGKASAYQVKLLRQALAQLQANLTWADGPLEDIPDSKHVYIPSGCVVKQIAIQTRVNRVSKLQMDKNLWARLDEDNRAAVMMHESIYSEAIDIGQPNSIPTRALNGSFSGDGYLYEYDLRAARRDLGFPEFYAAGSGETLILPNGGRADLHTIDVCGMDMPSFTIPCDLKQIFQVKLGEGGAVSKIYRAMSGAWLGLWFDVKDASLLDHMVTPAKEVPFEFGGFKFYCAADSAITLKATGPADPKIPFANYGVQKCRARGEGDHLPARNSDQLVKRHDYYATEFFYDANGKPSGMVYQIDDGEEPWEIGLTLQDDMLLKSYSENWASNTFTVGGGEVSLDDGYNRCATSSGGTFALRDKKVKIIEAYFMDPCYVNGRTLWYVKQDEFGKIEKAAFPGAIDFAGLKLEFYGNVEFKDGVPWRGKLDKQPKTKVPLIVNGQRVIRWILPSLTYENNQGNLVLSKPGERTDRGIGDVMATIDSAGEQELHVALLYDTQFTPDLIFLSGKTGYDASQEVPVCVFDPSNEQVHVENQWVPRETKIKSRDITNPWHSGEACFWVDEKN